MTTEQVKKAAKHIIEDRHGADYYKDIAVLAPYLKNALSLSQGKAEEKAKAIQDDRNGSNYYEDVDVLTNFLQR